MAVVKAVEANDTITLNQIAVVLGKSRSTVKRIVNSLKEKGLLGQKSGVFTDVYKFAQSKKSGAIFAGGAFYPRAVRYLKLAALSTVS